MTLTKTFIRDEKFQDETYLRTCALTNDDTGKKESIVLSTLDGKEFELPYTLEVANSLINTAQYIIREVLIQQGNGTTVVTR